jgi:hypothetical protein
MGHLSSEPNGTQKYYLISLPGHCTDCVFLHTNISTFGLPVFPAFGLN